MGCWGIGRESGPRAGRPMGRTGFGCRTIGKKDVAGLLLMPASGEGILHRNDCCKWKEPMGGEKRPPAQVIYKKTKGAAG